MTKEQELWELLRQARDLMKYLIDNRYINADRDDWLRRVEQLEKGGAN